VFRERFRFAGQRGKPSASDLLTGLFLTCSSKFRVKGEEMENERKEKDQIVEDSLDCQEPAILEEIDIEELAVDGICGIY
jgi:mycofactocin precursor